MTQELADFKLTHKIFGKANLSTQEGAKFACEAMKISPILFKLFLQNSDGMLDITMRPYGEDGDSILALAYQNALLIDVLSSLKTTGEIDLSTTRGQMVTKMAITKSVLGAFLALPRVTGNLDMNAVVAGQTIKKWAIDGRQLNSLYISDKAYGEDIALNSPLGLGLLYCASIEENIAKFLSAHKVKGTVSFRDTAPDLKSPILEAIKHGQFEATSASGKLTGELQLSVGTAPNGLPIYDPLGIEMVKEALKSGGFGILDQYLEGSVNLNFQEEGRALVSYAQDDATLAAFLSSGHVTGTLDLNTEINGIPVVDHNDPALGQIFGEMLKANRLAVVFDYDDKEHIQKRLTEINEILFFAIGSAEYLTQNGEIYLSNGQTSAAQVPGCQQKYILATNPGQVFPFSEFIETIQDLFDALGELTLADEVIGGKIVYSATLCSEDLVIEATESTLDLSHLRDAMGASGSHHEA